MHLESSTRDEIREEWLQCRRSMSGAPIVKFECRDIDQVDVDGHYKKEQDEKKARHNPGELCRHRNIQSSQHTTVLFPGEARGMDQESRSLWYFRRALFRRTAACYSFKELDKALCHLVHVHIGITEPESEPAILDNAFNLLSRLPETPLELPSIPSPPEPTEDGQRSWEDVDVRQPIWENLNVVRHVSRTTICMALTIAATWDRRIGMKPKTCESLEFAKFTNRMSELIDSATYEMGKAKRRRQEWRWFIVKAFLWSTWQRCVSLHYWRILQDQLAVGFDYHDLAELTLRPNLESAAVSEKQIDCKPEYMCTLAYRNLSRSKSTSILDLREFQASFKRLFGNRKGRCQNRRSCKGNFPTNCQRIRGASIVDQSQHDRLLCNCRPMKWDENSYRSFSGARAVSIADSIADAADSGDGLIRYQNASSTTIAISHVWSHGQGGRPESGLNSCLHNRYKKIAEGFDCTSYWIDAACIPTPHDLREEAIMTINSVFLESKVVLICDKDLIEIDVSVILDRETSMTNDAVALRELILATLLVCDWNMRAWTLLEALRGRAHISLMCKSGSENACLSLAEILQVVSSHGRINIGILLLTNYHLFPSPHSREWLERNTSGQMTPSQDRVKRWQDRGIYHVSFDAMRMAERIGNGFLNISEAASLLAHRFASRKGDDVIIWSLLVGDDVIRKASCLWKKGSRDDFLTTRDRPVGHARVYTSFLLSGVPRLTKIGLRWAPSQPGLPLERTSEESPRFPAYDGSMSRTGVIEIPAPHEPTRVHLRAEWGVSKIEFSGGCPYAYNIPTFRPLHTFVEDSLIGLGFSEGILLQPLQEDELGADADGRERSSEKKIALASLYKGSLRGPLFALCGRKKSSEEAWTWLGVFDWGNGKPLPYFHVQEVLLD